MGDYQLDPLGNREFEHLTQALAKAEIASGVTPWGDGKDGGREATFEGIMSYPTQASPWNGYLVLQSKFKSRPTSDTRQEGDWIIKQLKDELKKFLDPNRNLRKPDYYILATNIRLTAVAESGSKDKVLRILEDYAPKLGLKSYDVWSYDEICRFLDKNADIRKAYAHFTTPGDVISQLQDKASLFDDVTKGCSEMTELIKQFKEERQNDEIFQDIIPQLQHYSSKKNEPQSVSGLEAKLRAAGYEYLLEFATETKEIFAKKLTAYQFSKTAQEMHALLLAEVYTRFHHCVLPSIHDGKSQSEVQMLVEKSVIKPVSDMLGENVLKLHADDLTGMLYFLTGNCHIKWANA